MTAKPAATHASTASPGPKEPDLAERKRYFKGAQTTTSVGTAFQQTNDPPANSEQVAHLYTRLVTSFGSNDSEAVRLVYRELLRLGRSRAEILAEVARFAAAQEPKPITLGSLAKATT